MAHPSEMVRLCDDLPADARPVPAFKETEFGKVFLTTLRAVVSLIIIATVAAVLFLLIAALMSKSLWAGERAGCGSSAPQAKAVAPRLDAAAPGKSLLYFIGTGMHFLNTAVLVDGQLLGAHGRNNYLAVAVDPGIHHLCGFTFSTLNDSSIGGRDMLMSLTTEPDRVYYIRSGMLGDAWLPYEPYPRLVIYDDDEGPAALKRVKPQPCKKHCTKP